MKFLRQMNARSSGMLPSRLFVASMNIRDDVTLIRQFLTHDPTPGTSQNFHLESALDVTQLLSQSGELLAQLDHLTQPLVLLIKSGTQYWTLLHQISSE